MTVFEEAMAEFNAAFERAVASGRRNMNAMSLATVNAAGAPQGKPYALEPPRVKRRSPFAGFRRAKVWTLNVSATAGRVR